MALTDKQIKEKAAQYTALVTEQENLDLEDFELEPDSKFFVNKKGYKLNKLTFVGLDCLALMGIPFKLVAPPKGVDKDGKPLLYCRAWL